MKKSYIQPELISVTIVTATILNKSAEFTQESASVDGSGNLNNAVKRQDSYNVWDDDWSK